MRLIGALLTALLISCFLTQVQASGSVEPGDIAEPSITGANMDVPAPIVTAPNMDMPSPNPKPLAKPKPSSKTALNNTGNGSSNVAIVPEQQEPEAMNVSGRWSIIFGEGTDRSMDLNLWSAGKDIIMGFGTMTEAGAGTSVAASGSVDSNELKLIIKSASPGAKNNEYDLDLFMLNNTLSGTYVQKSGGQFSGKGNATAVRQ